MRRSGEEIWIPALIFFLLVAGHLFAARMGDRARRAISRRRLRRKRLGENDGIEYRFASNESIRPR